MKKILFFVLFTLCSVTSFCQLSATFEKDTLSIERDKSVDQTFHLLINISGINGPGGALNTINFAINPSPATTFALGDIAFPGTAVTVGVGVTQIDCPITILHGANTGDATLYLSLQLSFLNPAAQQKNMVLKIVNKPEKKDDAKKKNPLEIGAISIGHSFDFFGKSNSLISYADIYIFSPNVFSIGEKATKDKYGFALKLYQNKSVTIDSLNTSGNMYQFVNQTLVNPFQAPVNDSVFLKQELLTRKASYKSNNWGMYLRLFRDISYTNKKIKFYLGVHGEFLRRDIETTYEYKTQRDTVIKIKSNQIPFSGNTPVSKVITQSELYVSPFIQFAYVTDDITAHFSLVPLGLNLLKHSMNLGTVSKVFYIGQFDLVINKINIKLGGECRGLYHAQNQPYWNVFISKSFSWDKLTSLLF